MTKVLKTHSFSKHFFNAKRNLLDKLPKLLDNNKLAKRRAKPDPLETCIKQSADPNKCKKFVSSNKTK
ncbi:MAG: hypothetical protein GX559_00210 [Candidatus Pacebacteria bacterium]|nr:hypothetical protein [Candidatus Paceibacterota bacterium]